MKPMAAASATTATTTATADGHDSAVKTNATPAGSGPTATAFLTGTSPRTFRAAMCAVTERNTAKAAKVPATATTDVRHRLWQKLAINAAINPVTALARVENGALTQPGDLADVATAAGTETARVARADGVDLSATTVREGIADVVDETARNRSSMHQDVAAGRRTEIEAINGYVVERASAVGESVPVNRTLAALIRGWEAGAGRR